MKIIQSSVLIRSKIEFYFLYKTMSGESNRKIANRYFRINSGVINNNIDRLFSLINKAIMKQIKTVDIEELNNPNCVLETVEEKGDLAIINRDAVRNVWKCEVALCYVDLPYITADMIRFALKEKYVTSSLDKVYPFDNVRNLDFTIELSNKDFNQLVNKATKKPKEKKGAKPGPRGQLKLVRSTDLNPI